MSRRSQRLLAAGALAVLLSPLRADAHAVGLSRGQYSADPLGLSAELTFAPAEIAPLLATPQQILDRIHVSDAGGRRCPGSLQRVRASDSASVTLQASFRCPERATTLRVQLDFWDAVSPGHRHVVDSQVYQRERASFEIAGAPPPGQAPGPGGWVRLGIEHILTGYDHLAFLLALVLVASTLRKLAACISVFTLAHSVTLALASLDVVAPPSALVECAIALSICYVGVENLTARARRPRYPLVFGFGLIHGFGFAGALRELGLAPAQTPLALFGFNLGVELGQLALLACVYPLVLGLRRGGWFQRRGVPALSLAIALAGALWFAQRARAAGAGSGPGEIAAGVGGGAPLALPLPGHAGVLRS